MAQMTLPLEWEQATFTIQWRATEGKATKEVRGITSGPFGIFKQGKDNYCLTHVPSGLSIAYYSDMASAEHAAIRLATVEEVDWNSLNPLKGSTPPHQPLSPEIMKRIRSLK